MDMETMTMDTIPQEAMDMDTLRPEPTQVEVPNILQVDLTLESLSNWMEYLALFIHYWCLSTNSSEEFLEATEDMPETEFLWCKCNGIS